MIPHMPPEWVAHYLDVSNEVPILLLLLLLFKRSWNDSRHSGLETMLKNYKTPGQSLAKLQPSLIFGEITAFFDLWQNYSPLFYLLEKCLIVHGYSMFFFPLAFWPVESRRSSNYPSRSGRRQPEFVTVWQEPRWYYYPTKVNGRHLRSTNW